MPITAGIKCAYCNAMLENDFVMEIHLKGHKKIIQYVRDRENARDNIRRNKESNQY